MTSIALWEFTFEPFTISSLFFFLAIQFASLISAIAEFAFCRKAIEENE